MSKPVFLSKVMNYKQAYYKLMYLKLRIIAITFSLVLQHIIHFCMYSLGRECRGRILGRNWDISLKSFAPCYSQSRFLLFPPLEQKWLETDL